MDPIILFLYIWALGKKEERCCNDTCEPYCRKIGKLEDAIIYNDVDRVDRRWWGIKAYSNGHPGVAVKDVNDFLRKHLCVI